MKKSTIAYYKKTIRLAEGASSAMSMASVDYEHGCEVAKGAYEADFWR